MPGGIDEEIAVYAIDLFIGLQRMTVANPKGGFTEFADRVPTLLDIEPSKKADFMHICHGSTAFAGLHKGLFGIEADSAGHGCSWRCQMQSQILPT
jgi:hypothetical protein